MKKGLIVIIVLLYCTNTVLCDQNQEPILDGHYWLRMASDPNPLMAESMKLMTATYLLNLMQQSYNTIFSIKPEELVVLFDEFYSEEENLNTDIFTVFLIVTKEQAKRRLQKSGN